MRTKLVLMVALASVCLAQQAPPPEMAGRGSAGSVQSNIKSNEQSNVDIDRFIGDPLNSPVHLSHGTLLTHSILRAGDPYKPGAHGAVLEYRKELATATLLGKNVTPLSTLPDEFFFIVNSGEGRMDDGKQSWDLHPGIAILAPPNVPHRFTNTSDQPLRMVMLTWTAAGSNPGNSLIVRDVNLLGYCEENAHWNNTSKCIFSSADGLFQNERMFVVMLQPWAASQPHSHTPGTEEIWTKLTPGTSPSILGSELREMPEDSAYLVPPTGITEHSNLNLSKDKVEWWLYVARGPAAPGNRQTTSNATAGNLNASNPGRGGAANRNPNISRDTAPATIAGKPLP